MRLPLMAAAADPLAGAVIFDFAQPAGTQIVYNRNVTGAAISAKNGSTATADTNDATFNGAGISFGADDYLKVISSWFDDMPRFTVITAMKVNNAGASGRIFDKSQRYLFINATTGALNFIQSWSGGDARWNSSQILIYGANTISGFSYDGTGTTKGPIFYLNSAKNEPSPLIPPTGTVISDAASDLFVGNKSTADRTFDGTIYYQAWFPRMLSDSQYLAAYRRIKSILNARGIAI